MQDEQVVGRLVNPGGSAAEWRARYAVLDGKRYEKRVVQYAARHAGQSVPDGRSPEQHESYDALLPKSRKRPAREPRSEICQKWWLLACR